MHKLMQIKDNNSQHIILHHNIIVWRHADAVPLLNAEDCLIDDNSRPLSDKGQQQAIKMARWLKRHLPKEFDLQSSPALRAFQTAQVLQCKVAINPALKPRASLQQILSAIAMIPPQSHLLLVGHQPWMGQLVAYLLGINEAEFDIKKGAIWWLRQLEFIPKKYEMITLQTPSKL